MNARKKTISITDECRNCGHHIPAHIAMKAAECPICHSGELGELIAVDVKSLNETLNQAPQHTEYTVVFRMEGGGYSRRSFMQKLTDTFVDHEVEIVEIQSGNKLRLSGGH